MVWLHDALLKGTAACAAVDWPSSLARFWPNHHSLLCRPLILHAIELPQSADPKGSLARAVDPDVCQLLFGLLSFVQRPAVCCLQRFRRALVASEPDRDSRKSALLMQQAVDVDEGAPEPWEDVLAPVVRAGGGRAGRPGMDSSSMRAWQRFVQRSRMAEVGQMWDMQTAEDDAPKVHHGAVEGARTSRGVRNRRDVPCGKIG